MFVCVCVQNQLTAVLCCLLSSRFCPSETNTLPMCVCVRVGEGVTRQVHLLLQCAVVSLVV